MNNLALAQYVIRQLKAERPTCPQCMYEHLSKRPKGGDEWQELPQRNTWVRRCRDCWRGFAHPWAYHLDATKVAQMMATDPRFSGNQIPDLTILKETL